MKKQTLIYIIALVAATHSAIAQQSKTDSLLAIIKSDIHDTVKIQDILNFGTNIQSTSKDSALYYYNWALELADKGIVSSSSLPQIVNVFLKLKANSLRYIGIVYYYEGTYDKAVDFFINSLKISEALDDKIGISLCYGNIGAIQINLGNFEKGIVYFEKLLKTFEEMGDKASMGACYNNIGAIYQYQEKYDEAFENYHKSLKIFEVLDDKNRISDCYSNIGLIKVIQGKHNEAIDYYTQALSIYKTLGNTNGETTIYCSIANLHITIADSVAKTPNEKSNHLKLASEFGVKSIDLAQKIKSIPLEGLAANALMNAYKKLGNAQEALKYAEIFIATTENMFSEEKTKALAEMEAKYEADKKQQEIEKQQLVIQNKEIEYSRQRIKLNLFISGSVLLALLVLVILYVYRQKYISSTIISEKNSLLEQLNEEINATSEALKSQNEKLTLQNNEIETQKNDLANIAWELQDKNLEVEAQRTLVDSQNKEITDSIVYAQRIQSALIPSQQALTEIFPNHFILFKPKSIVSGDFYWATKVKRWTVFCVADCTGHGVPGAFMSMLGVSFLNEIVRKDEVVNAADILNQIRSQIISSLKEECSNYIQVDGMDMALCVLDNHTLKLQYAGANLPCWIVPSSNNSNIDLVRKTSISEKVEINAMPDSKTLIELQPNRMPLSLYQRMSPFESTFFQLNEGDTIYLMSDGFQDQFGGPNGKKFQTLKLKEAISKLSSLPLTMQHQFLNDIFEDWKKDKIQLDDVTIMGVKV